MLAAVPAACDIERQAADTDKEFIQRHARQNAGTADPEMNPLGMDTSEMKAFVSIFICLFDPFGKGSVKYTGKTMCMENLEGIIGSGMTQICLDAKTILDSSRQISPELKSLPDFIAGKEEQNPTPLTEALKEKEDRHNEDKSKRSHAGGSRKYLPQLPRKLHVLSGFAKDVRIWGRNAG